MTRTLQPHGNGLALVLNEALLEQLQIEADTPLQLKISGGSLIVTPVHAEISRAEIADTMEKLRPRYRQMLGNLAK